VVERSPASLLRAPRAAAALWLLAVASAHAFTIVPTFDSSITSDANAAAIITTIQSAIAVYEQTFADPIIVNITFDEFSSGLGQSLSTFTTIRYSSYLADLTADATSADDFTALANLPTGSRNPVNNGRTLDIHTALLRALGVSDFTLSDGTISLNTSLMNLSVDGPQNPSKYSLFAVAQHEIDEVLGLGSSLFGATVPANISPEDLFRYDQSGSRSYTTSTSAQAYFSLDGVTDIARFNQDGIADFGDWYSPGDQTPQVQDAYGTPGSTPTLGPAEIKALDVTGYTIATVPEPSSGALLLTAVGLGLLSRRRWRRVR
jgi:hypothetical protein